MIDSPLRSPATWSGDRAGVVRLEDGSDRSCACRAFCAHSAQWYPPCPCEAGSPAPIVRSHRPPAGPVHGRARRPPPGGRPVTRSPAEREAIPEPENPLGIAGIEFIEYATAKPQALGDVLELMGFRPVARHRSREVLLYRQGTMNVVVNADPDPLHRAAKPDDVPAISAIALRVARCRPRLQAHGGAGRVGDPDARRRDGTQHPGHPRRRRQRDLLRRPLRGPDDLRRRLPPDPLGRRASARARRPALVRHRPVHRRRPHAGLARLLRAADGLRRRCRARSASASCPRARCSRVPAARSTCS